MITLRQIEVLRAVMITGTIAGAAKLLNVAAPGVSRLMKYTEKSLKMRLFERRNGRYAPTPEAQDIFEQINGVYKKVDDLQFVLSRLDRGRDVEFRFASVPSIAHVMAPRAVEKLRARHPDLKLDINIIKIEEVHDYLLLGRGELAAMSYRFDHPTLDFTPLATGRLFCIVPEKHALAKRTRIAAAEIVRHPLIGIDPNDPYGRVMADIFRRQKLTYDMIIRARFGTTVCALVKAGLGIAIIDQFTVAHGSMPGIKLLEIEEPTEIQTYIAARNDVAPSAYAQNFVRYLRDEMTAVAGPTRAGRTDQPAQGIT